MKSNANVKYAPQAPQAPQVQVYAPLQNQQDEETVIAFNADETDSQNSIQSKPGPPLGNWRDGHCDCHHNIW